MRKSLIAHPTETAPLNEPSWLDLEAMAQVEISSESPHHPIEHALSGDNATGWQAADSGEQTIRFLFDAPQRLTRIKLCFREEKLARTQEFVLRWCSRGSQWQEIVRQQYHFSPPGTTEEIEDYQVDLHGVTALELVIVPDTAKGSALASLAKLRIA